MSNAKKKWIVAGAVILLLNFNKSFSQSIYVKFKSDKNTPKQIGTVYISGLSNGLLWQQSMYLPTPYFHQLPCDSLVSVTLEYSHKAFNVLDNHFICGDSVIVDIDNRTSTIINRRKISN